MIAPAELFRRLIVLREQAAAARQALSRQEAERQSLLAEQRKINWRLDQREAMETLFVELRRRIDGRAVGDYEALLNGMVQDVLPDRQREVRLMLEVDRGCCALDLAVTRSTASGTGPVDPSRASGGSLRNILGMGLRLSAIAKSGQRMLAILDEADCWIEDANVAPFLSMLHQVCAEAGLQCLMLTHHNPALFPPEAGRVILSSGGEKGIAAEFSGRSATGHKLSWIRLQDFQSHVDTTIPLCDGLTILTGPNDLGKSAVVQAFAALAEYDFKDSDIRIGAKRAEVSVGFADGRVASVMRPRHGRARFLLLGGPDGDRESLGAETPDFISEALNIRRVENLLLQVGMQSDPAFLVTGSARLRAALLAITRQDTPLPKMMAGWKRQCAEDQANRKLNEEVLKTLERRTDALKILLDGLPEDLFIAWEAELATLTREAEVMADLGRQALAIATDAAAVARLSGILTLPLPAAPEIEDAAAPEQTGRQIALDALAVARLSGILALPLPTAPEIEDLAALEVSAQSLIAEAAAVARLSGILALSLPVAPSLEDATAPDEAGQAIGREAQAAARLSGILALPLPVPPELAAVREVEISLRGLASEMTQVKTVRTSLTAAESELAEALTAHAALVAELGGKCPVCDGPLDARH